MVGKYEFLKDVVSLAREVARGGKSFPRYWWKWFVFWYLRCLFVYLLHCLSTLVVLFLERSQSHSGLIWRAQNSQWQQRCFGDRYRSFLHLFLSFDTYMLELCSSLKTDQFWRKGTRHRTPLPVLEKKEEEKKRLGGRGVCDEFPILGPVFRISFRGDRGLLVLPGWFVVIHTIKTEINLEREVVELCWIILLFYCHIISQADGI